MKLKRNFFTILYAVLFVGFMGSGFAVTAGLLLTSNAENYLNACIFALSLLIYLISAFFLKEKGIMLAAEGKESLYVILEAVLVLASAAGIVFLDISKGTDKLVWIVLILLCTYAASRLLGGRLCGILGLLLCFFYLVSVTGYSVVEQEYMDCLCFFVPFIFFLLIVHVLTPRYSDNGFILVSSYFLLSVVFTFAIIMNPFTAVLFIGCVLALVFGTAEKQMFLSGPILAGIFFAVTMLFLVAAWIFLGDLLILPEWIPDETLFSYTSLVEAGLYILDKYTKGMAELIEPFGLGIFPAFITFMGTAAGYYAIRKKTSAVGPLCLSFVSLFIVYILYGETGSHFYYMPFFLPVFAAYAFACSLLPDNWNVAGNSSAEKENQDFPENEEFFDSVSAPDTDSEETVYELQLEKNEKTEDILAAEPLFKPVEEPVETRRVQLEPARVEPGQVMVERPPVVPGQNVQKEEESVDRPLKDIPEWRVSEGFLQDQNSEMAGNTAGEAVAKQQTRQVQTPIPEPKPVPGPKPVPRSEVIQPDETQSLLEPVVQLEPAQEDMIKTGVFAPEPKNENIAVPDSDLLEEDNGSIENNVISNNDNDLLSAFSTDENMISAPLQEKDGQDAEEDESKLNDLLNRLDISDNIRRMNESAQEDRADVIERDDENVELAAAIPTEEFDGLTDVAEGSDLIDISSLSANIKTEESELQPEPDLLPESGPELESELLSESSLDLESELLSEPSPELESELLSEPNLDLESELLSEPNLDLESDLFSESGVELSKGEPAGEEDMNMLDLDSFTPSDIPEEIFEERIPEPADVQSELEEPEYEEPDYQIETEQRHVMPQDIMPKEIKPQHTMPQEVIPQAVIPPEPEHLVQPEQPVQPVQPEQPVQPVISEYDKVPTINDLERKWRNLSGNDSHEMANGFAYSLEDVRGANVLSDAVRPEESELPEIEEYTVADELPEAEEYTVGGELPEAEEYAAVRKLPEIEEQLEFDFEETPEPQNLMESKSLSEPESFSEPESLPKPEPLTENPSWRETDRKISVSPVSLVVEETAPLMAKEVHSEQIIKKNGAGKRSYHKITWS